MISGGLCSTMVAFMRSRYYSLDYDLGAIDRWPDVLEDR